MRNELLAPGSATCIKQVHSLGIYLPSTSAFLMTSIALPAMTKAPTR